jgi:hypothetical protein
MIIESLLIKQSSYALSKIRNHPSQTEQPRAPRGRSEVIESIVSQAVDPSHPGRRGIVLNTDP